MTPSLRRIACCTVWLAALGGCAGSYSPGALKTGASMQEVTAALGQPTGRYPRDGGERVEYARGPFGQHTYMLDFDAQGRLTGWEQVLNEPHFNAVRAGISRDELLLAIGHPSDARALPVQDRTLWSYRYEGPFCQWFQVGLDRSGRVVDTGYGPDPRCTDFSMGTP
jgi:hypothetical protein